MGVQKATCPRCGRPVELREESDGAWRPHDRGGGPHRCPAQASTKQGGRAGASGGERDASAPAASRSTPAAGGGGGRSPWLAVLLVGAVLGVGWWWLESRPGGFALPPAPGAPSAAPTADEPGAAGGAEPTTSGAASGAGDGCRTFDSQVWAQSVYDADPKRHADLGPDARGLVCDWLPVGAAPALWTDEVPERAQRVAYVDTIDGDTIVVRMPNGTTEHVRLLMINTPETGEGYRALECYGKEATAFTREMLGWADGTVWLEQDVENRDQYDRLLRYVWFKAGGDVYLANEAIVRSGFGRESVHKPNVKYVRRLDAAQAFAKAHDYGVWGSC